MKGIYKGFKYITQIFVGKEKEIEIGGPTDVKHVSHIGWDGGSGNDAPSWMNKFQTASDFAETSIGKVKVKVKEEGGGGGSNNKNTCSSSSSQLVDGELPASHKDMAPSGKKHKRKKPKLHSTTSPRSVTSSTRVGSRGTKSKSKPKPKAKLMEENTKGAERVEL